MDEVTQPGIHWMQPFVTEMVALRRGHFKKWMEYSPLISVNLSIFNREIHFWQVEPSYLEKGFSIEMHKFGVDSSFISYWGMNWKDNMVNYKLRKSGLRYQDLN